MMRAAVDGQRAWRALSDQTASLAQQPAPTVIHFARFEQSFLRTLGAGLFPLDVVCTRDIARRLLPNLPRCSLLALAGYLGRAVGALRRSADHVKATAFVWQELVRLLETKGVSTWSALHDCLAAPVEPTRCRPRVWPMPRDVRLSLPHAFCMSAFKPTLHHLADRNGARLRATSLAGWTITVRVRFADLRSVTRSLTLTAPISATRALAEIAEDLVRGVP